jgi:hypothetical protein
MTTRQKNVQNALHALVHQRFNKKTLESKLKYIFGVNSITLCECEDEYWSGDWYYSFEINDEELGGFFDIYHLMMRPKPKDDDDGLRFYVTEVSIGFDRD